MVQNVTQFKIFLSSPGDVPEERDIVRELIKEVLPYSPFIRGRATFDVVSWDDPHAAPGLDAHLTPQEAINRKLPKPSECDIVIAILWSRMGTPLPPEITRDDGSIYQSGTEWEFEDGVNTAKEKGSPTILLYRKTEEPKIGLDSPKLHEKVEQYQKVNAFFENFRDAGGSLTGSFATYETIDAFRELLRQHLESAASGFLRQEFSEELGVTKAAVEAMLAILKEQQVAPSQLEAKLKEIAERHLELTERLHALSKTNDEPETTKRRERAAEAIENGDYDRADELLAEAVAIDRRAIDKQQEELDRRKLSAAATIGQQGQLKRARLSYRKAAKHFAEAASLTPASESETRLDYLTDQALSFYDLGKDFGDNSALPVAIDIYQAVLTERRRATAPLDWARAQMNLGNALSALGERESTTERLEQAVKAFSAALEERTRERFPLDWAAAQDGLGLALWKLGERENGTQKLKQAVSAFRAALEERTRKRVPIEWATTQNNLGLALWRLGSRENGTQRLKQAVDAFETALEESSRGSVPLSWAMTQNNLGLALSTLGERESTTDRLEDAISAFHAALEEHTRDRLPLHWAMTQHCLGGALLSLGSRESGTQRLEEAIKAFQAAQEEWTRERLPLDWAKTQWGVGAALTSLGERGDGIERLEQAIAAYRSALQEATRERVPMQWARTQRDLGLAYQALAEKSRDKTILRQGIEAIKAALEGFDEERAIYQIEITNRDLARAEALLAELTGLSDDVLQ